MGAVLLLASTEMSAVQEIGPSCWRYPEDFCFIIIPINPQSVSVVITRVWPRLVGCPPCYRGLCPLPLRPYSYVWQIFKLKCSSVTGHLVDSRSFAVSSGKLLEHISTLTPRPLYEIEVQ